MRTNRLNSLLAVGLLAAVALACNFNFTTANISSVTLSRSSSAGQQTTSFSPNDTVYAIAAVGGAGTRHKVKGRVLFGNVEGYTAGDAVPGLETEVELPGSGTATFNFSVPGRGWPNGTYRVEVTLFNDRNEQVDQKTAEFTVTGGQSGRGAGAPPANANADDDQ